jgi:hypothetical protein
VLGVGLGTMVQPLITVPGPGAARARSELASINTSSAPETPSAASSTRVARRLIGAPLLTGDPLP